MGNRKVGDSDDQPDQQRKTTQLEKRLYIVDGIQPLSKGVDTVLFPDLWDVRTELKG